MHKKKIKYLFLACLFIALPAIDCRAAMRSGSYVIYENVMHAFDGPVISNVSHSVSGQSVTVTWTTDVQSDNFVVYSTDSSFATSKEQGSSEKAFISHSVTLTGLSANTAYFYRVRSERVNGGITTDNTLRTFTTGSDQQEEEEEENASSGGGGILIIDKTDNTPPAVSGLDLKVLDPTSVSITWRTDEDSTSFIEYGTDTGYGSVYGHWDSAKEHAVTLKDLSPKTLYNFRALSSDGWGNIGYSENRSFTTLEGIKEEKEDGEDEEDEPVEITDEEAGKAVTIFNRLFPEISLKDLTPDDMNNFLSSPEIVGVPRVEAGATEAAFYWNTNFAANSLVAIAPEGRYDPNSSEPYLQIVGNIEESTTSHQVSIYGLVPDTLYHYQVQNKSHFGPTAKSQDYTFRTGSEELKIESFLSQVLNNETAAFKWVTNKNADSMVRVTPYHGDDLAVAEMKVFRNNEQAVIHEMEISEFQEGNIYEVEIISTDRDGRMASETFSRFSTSEEDLPPVISHIKADSTVFVEQSDKIQTVISWMTNEPSNSRVYYQEGVHGGDVALAESTELNQSYTKKHIVLINNFKPGTVYSFRVESVDSGGNASISKAHTFMTAKKKESIIQIILNILEETFGWLKNIL